MFGLLLGLTRGCGFAWHACLITQQASHQPLLGPFGLQRRFVCQAAQHAEDVAASVDSFALSHSDPGQRSLLGREEPHTSQATAAGAALAEEADDAPRP